jgi:hypothetical protein
MCAWQDDGDDGRKFVADNGRQAPGEQAQSKPDTRRLSPSSSFDSLSRRESRGGSRVMSPSMAMIPSLSESRASLGEGESGEGEVWDPRDPGISEEKEEREVILDPQGGQEFVLGDFRITSPRIGGVSLGGSESDGGEEEQARNTAEAEDPRLHTGRAPNRSPPSRTRSLERSQPFTIYLGDDFSQQGPLPASSARCACMVASAGAAARLRVKMCTVETDT